MKRERGGWEDWVGVEGEGEAGFTRRRGGRVEVRFFRCESCLETGFVSGSPVSPPAAGARSKLAKQPWSDYGHFMEMTVTQFKAKCLGIVDKVEKEKTRVTITRHGRPAAQLVPVLASAPGQLFGRSRDSTVIRGDLMHVDEDWEAED